MFRDGWWRSHYYPARMMRRHWFLAVAALLLSVQSPQAGDAPLLAPTRTVAVTYELFGASQQAGAKKLRVIYDSEGRVRMDFYRFLEAPTPFAWLIYDPPANRITTVLPERHGYVQSDLANRASPGAFLNAGMSFTRLGKATIAGLECTDWRVVDGTGNEGSACVTDDGVVLRANREKPIAGRIEAVSVQYPSLPSDLFVPPAPFKLIPNPDFPQIKPPGWTQ
jgi:hypothetical protein